jgi:hypothetical protein
MFKKIALLLSLLPFSLSAARLPSKLPLEIRGGDFDTSANGAKRDVFGQAAARAAGAEEGDQDLAKSFTRKVNFRTPGVWYLWLKVRSASETSSLLTYDLDGDQPLHSARSQILVQPQPAPQWVSYSRYPGFKVEVHVARAGNHLLTFHLKSGNVVVEKILATLFYSAQLTPKGILDHSHDPGLGKAFFPQSPLAAAGYREDYRSPEVKAAGRALYVDSEAGNDSAAGTSPSQAWKTLARANAEVFQPGDGLFLKRGGHWNGGLAPRGSGTAERWITVAAFGTGPRPWINGLSQPALKLSGQDYWRIQDLQLTSDPEYRQTGLLAEVPKDAPRAKGLDVVNCLAFDNGESGFDIGGNKGYDGVVLENCLSFCNGSDGIQVAGESATDCRNVLIRRCTAYSNPGMAGIWINGGQNGLIEDCVAYNNACVNIWAWNAINITIRRCEAFRGRPPQDASGFDLDWGTQACTLEYCYGHQDEGDDFLLMGSGEADYNGHSMHSDYDLVRHCVAEGGEPVDLIETFQHGKFVHNLCMAFGPDAVALDMGGWIDKSRERPDWAGGWPSDTEISDNLFLGLEGAAASWVDNRATGQGNRFERNLYWAPEAKAPLVRWGGKKNGPHFWEGDDKTGSEPPQGFTSLADFQKATGQEAGGLQADPQLFGAGWGEVGRLPLKHARLQPGMPAKGAGRDLELDEAWLKGRRAYLEETGAAAYGIPMQPGPEKGDYWGTVAQGKPSLGP